MDTEAREKLILLLKQVWNYGEEYQRGGYHPLSYNAYLDIWVNEVEEIFNGYRKVPELKVLSDEETMETIRKNSTAHDEVIISIPNRIRALLKAQLDGIKKQIEEANR